MNRQEAKDARRRERESQDVWCDNVLAGNENKKYDEPPRGQGRQEFEE
jgi:hypothetical protein